jgi:hypothetical protein
VIVTGFIVAGNGISAAAVESGTGCRIWFFSARQDLRIVKLVRIFTGSCPVPLSTFYTLKKQVIFI